MAVEVFDRFENDAAVKLDVLWMIDNSSSMCEEQVRLAQHFGGFVEALQSSMVLDARMAVVTTNLMEDHAAFNTRHVSAFPPPCRRQVIKKCLSDEDCLLDTSDRPGLPVPPGNSRWSCNWSGKPPSTLENQNGSINSRCLLECDATSSCASVFSEDFICKEFEFNITEPGCMVPPPTATCPDAADLRPVVQIGADGQNIDLFQCIATVGADPSFNANLEQGLNAARFALDVLGPNAEQAKNFMREDAWLVIIFVSDEDDCSLPRDCVLDGEGDWQPFLVTRDCLRVGRHRNCPLMRDTEHGGPLEPVARYVEFFMSLKGDSARVLTAAIVGDARAADPDQRQSERFAYLASESAQQQFATNTYICSSDDGTADFGRRYIQLAEAFGANGVVANLCGPSPCVLGSGDPGTVGADGRCDALPEVPARDDRGMARALEIVSRHIIQRVDRFCLPVAMQACAEEDPAQPGRCLRPTHVDVLRRTVQGTTHELTRASEGHAPVEGQFQIELDASCPGAGAAFMFGDLRDRRDVIEVRYAGRTDPL